ncbi:FtsX-like permease family protein [Gemella sanguinis]|uniref:FtsX-like permease family protein n=1 Tax=Gemella sanguinis TaxID=84135 RepID=UPI0008076038|nr:FtsX-like permease family protein [Gemella sanguinis]
MIVQLKDLRKAIAVVIVSYCAVFITTLFSNLYLDLKGLDITGFNIIQKKFYDAQLIVSKFVVIITGTVLSISAAVMLMFYIKQFIDDSKHKIGILKAQGYSNNFIASKFSVFGFLVFLGSLLGYGCSHLFMPKFYESRNTDNILSELTINFHPQLLLIMVILPSLLFLVISIVYVLFNLNVPTINLLKQINSTNKKIRKRRFRQYKNFFKELRATVLFSNKTLLFFVIFAALSFSSMIQMAFGMRDFVDGTIRIMMMVIGVILSLSILLISLEVIANSNIKNISILNIMGYSKDECSRIILSGYRVVAHIGFAIGTVYQYFLIRTLLKVLSKKLDSETTYNFDLISVIGSFIAFVLIYEIFILYYSNRIKDLNVKKVMMD